MTRRGLALVVGALGSWAVGRLLGIDEFLVLAVAAATAVAAGALAVTLAGSAIAVRRRVTRTRLPAGESTRVVVDLRNESRLPVPVLLGEDQCADVLLESGDVARFVVPGLPRGATVPASYTVTGLLRGRYSIGPLTLRIRDPFGLVEKVRRYRATDELIVYPAIDPLPGGLSLGRHHGSGTSESRRLFNAGDEFHTMREYADGDDLRHVHWRSTAHRQRLMVRQNELPWDTQATVLCDTRAELHHGTGLSSSLERAVSAAASVVWHLDASGYRVRFATEADTRPPAMTTRDACLDRLAVLEPTRGRTLGPILQQLRSGEAEGLLVAVVPAPAETDEASMGGEISALLQVGRAFSGRLAIILDTGGPGSDERATRLAEFLSAAGWRAAAHGPRGPLGATWRDLMSGRRPRPTAYQPVSAAAVHSTSEG
jgi:uncharacterized protein (DUF58 family)